MLGLGISQKIALTQHPPQATSDEKRAERDDGETKEKQADNRQTAEENATRHTADTNAGKLPGGLDFDIKTAMDLFGLEHVKVIREPADDTKVLVGWSASTVVMAFRGTNSFTNAKRDAQVDPPTATCAFPHFL